MVTIVFSHPWHGSFCKFIMDKIAEKLEHDNKEYRIIDLDKDKFNPVMTEEELSLYSAGKFTDPLVGKYQETLSQTDEIIFIFPNWWNTAPAIMKGFFDKVMLKGFAFNSDNGWVPLLNINKTTVVTTSDSPTFIFQPSVDNSFLPMLNSAGIKNAVWLNCERVSKETDEYRFHFIDKVLDVI